MTDYPIKGTVKLVVDDATAKLVEAEKLADKLYHALALTKCDAERDGFEYGSQSNCVKAIKAYRRYSEANR